MKFPKKRWQKRAFLTGSFTVLPTLIAFFSILPHSSVLEPSHLRFNSTSQRYQSDNSHLLNLHGEAFSDADLNAVAEHTDWDANFALFQQKFKTKPITVNQLGLVDVFNLLSGWKQSLTGVLETIPQLQKEIKAANDIFPVNEQSQIPRVEARLFDFLGSGFFPVLNPKGLGLADNVASLFEQFQLASINLSGFEVKLIKTHDIVIKSKVRYSFEVQMQFHAVYQNNDTKANLDFALNISTINFATLQELQNSFDLQGSDLTAGLFYKYSVNKLTSGTNDLTTIAKTALGENIIQKQVSLTQSIIKPRLEAAKTQYKQDIIAPFAKERQAALAQHLKEIEEAKQRAEQLLKEQQEAEKRRQEEVKNVAETQQFNDSLTSAQKFKEYWLKQGKDVTKKVELIQALKSSFFRNQNRTFNFLIAGFRTAIDWYYNQEKNNTTAKNNAFGKNGIQFPVAGFQGIYMSQWLRDELSGKTDIKLNLKSLSVQNENKNSSINWNKQKRIEIKQVKPFNYSFEINLKYTGSYNVSLWYLIGAAIGGIPTSWSGTMDMKFIVDGDLDSGIVTKQDYPGSKFEFTEDKLWFTLHVKQQIKVKEQGFMNLLKGQSLDNLDLRTGTTKPPVVDLASYLHFVILTAK